MKTSIDANTTTVEDQAGKKRRSITNALGQLIRVDEPDASNNLGSVSSPYQPTVYGYDVLNNLLTVTQTSSTTAQCGGQSSCSQTRTFTYSSLSRLLTATNPESGTITYTYQNNGNLATKTDARGIVTTYLYDDLNRVTDRLYTNEPSGSETPDVEYRYGTEAPAIGKLIKVESSVSTTEYTGFDILGRVTASKQTTDGGAAGGYTSGYTYNLSGALVEQEYPSGRKVSNELDASGNLAHVKSKKNPNQAYWTYANHLTYNAAGAVTSMQLGNGTWESTAFNSRLQPTQIALGKTQSATNLLDLDYTYGTANQNNGNVMSQTITVASVGQTNGFTAAQAYSYDSLNRLKDATENVTPHAGSASQSWKQTFSFDRYGNRRFDFANGNTTIPESNCTEAICNPTISTANNRINSTGYSFDNAGNTTRDASDRKFTYDAENKQVKVEALSPGTNTVTGTIGEYLYDGDGKRVKKYVPPSGQDPGETTVFVYDAAGKLIAEHSTIVASVNDAKVAYLTNDHLGSPRINTDANGAVTARHDYHPFGEEIATSQRTSGLGYVDDAVRKQFTGYERDNESDLDFAEARMYNFQHGRFTSTDPIIMSFKRAIDPQRINLYAYSRNNPLRYIDPDGEDIVEPTGLSEEDQKAYEKWKAAYLATEAGKKTWERYQNDKGFMLKVVVADRESDSKNRSAKVDDFVFDADGNFTGATMTLGRNLGKGVPGDSESYPVSSTLDATDSARVGASKIAHEFGHLDDFRSLGTTFYEQQKIFDAIKSRVEDLGRQKRYRELDTDPTLRGLNESFQKKFGTTTTQEGINRDNRADKQAIPTIRQIFGNSLSDRTKKAMTKLERGN